MTNYIATYYSICSSFLGKTRQKWNGKLLNRTELDAKAQARKKKHKGTTEIGVRE